MTNKDATSKNKSKKTTEAQMSEQRASITINDFSKIDLRVGKIVEANHIEGADKLLQLKIDLGEETERQIFAGIKFSYVPEALVGRYVVVVANLKPRKMRFGLSEGMVLATRNDESGEIVLVSPDKASHVGQSVC